MVCKITSTNCSRRPRAGFILVEMIVGLAIGALVIAAFAVFSVFNARGFAGFATYATLDLANRKATDQMTKDFRMVQSLTNFSSSAISLVDFDGTSLQYSYSPISQTLSRIKSGVTTVLLRDCSRLSFSMGMRDLTNGTFDFFPTTNTFECKAITVNWCCSRKLLGVASDDMPQSETIVTRN